MKKERIEQAFIEAKNQSYVRIEPFLFIA